MFGWHEIHMASSVDDSTKVRDALDAKGIRYRYKIRNAYSDISRKMGTADVDMNYAFQYYLFVKKRDFEQARGLIENALRQGGA